MWRASYFGPKQNQGEEEDNDHFLHANRAQHASPPLRARIASLIGSATGSAVPLPLLKLSSTRAMDLNQDRSNLKNILCRKSVRLGDFTLVSGEKSSVYVDSKLTTYSPEAMPLVGRLFLQKMLKCGWHPEAVGGLTLGADPIAFSVARESLDTAHPINAFVVRKDAKSHGRGGVIAGLEAFENLPVVVIDDVCTKGGSTAQAIESAKAAGMIILGAICLVDRRQGATELLRDTFALRLESIFTLPELVEQLNGATSATEPVGTN
jgi:orotate phosphoribosyltransferase